MSSFKSDKGVVTFNGDRGEVIYDVLRKSDGITPADSYSEDVEHEGELGLYNDGNLTPLIKLAQFRL